MDIDELRKRFENDRFATVADGAVIDSVGPDTAVCSLEIGDVHRNASGAVMGGAIFTLADFAFAVATNQSDILTVTVSSTIEYIGSAHGSRIVATAKPDKVGRSMCFYTILVTDDEGMLVAKVSSVGKRTSRKI